MVNSNGFEYVDLGLPSGTLWSIMNVGASKPSDSGLYFQWGDTVGYTAAQVGTGDGKKKFASDWSDYKWGKSPNFTKYTTTGATLELEDDAAHVHMGGSWHMPTPDQIGELLNNTTSTWTTQEGVSGRLFTSKMDGSKSIFIPAAGDAWGGSVQGSGDVGFVLSSMLCTDSVYCGQGLYFYSGDVFLYGSHRCDGRAVRGVIDKNNDNSKDKKNDMNEKLNLVEILKDAPKGTKLWSPICGDCELVAVEDNLRPIHCTYKRNIISTQFNSYSETNIFFVNDESILFPSKENMDWSTFKIPNKHQHFEPYQKVLIKDKFMSKYLWVAALYSHFDTSTNKHYLVGADWAEDDDIISYEGNEDKLGKVIQ